MSKPGEAAGMVSRIRSDSSRGRRRRTPIFSKLRLWLLTIFILTKPMNFEALRARDICSRAHSSSGQKLLYSSPSFLLLLLKTGNVEMRLRSENIFFSVSLSLSPSPLASMAAGLFAVFCFYCCSCCYCYLLLCHWRHWCCFSLAR